ncbi:phosphotransferase [Nonomuraea sp. NPDC049709]|uniref:phosphotransferase n=1 Tax=Nonomuraea sp. NPDC049709 TaxID=3154736 RepID=UPI003426728F
MEAPAEAPASSDFGAHPKRCTGGFEQFLQAIDPDAVGDVRAVRAVWADAVAAPEWEGPPVWVHGDLHPANVVVSNGTWRPNELRASAKPLPDAPVFDVLETKWIDPTGCLGDLMAVIKGFPYSDDLVEPSPCTRRPKGRQRPKTSGWPCRRTLPIARDPRSRNSR